jgi:hypothetical protein
MKKQILISTIFACLSMTSFARIWRVNNNAGFNADFINLTAAITAAAATGDIIYVEPSATSYDENTTVVINKQVKIIGNGSFLTAHAGLQVNSNDSKFTNTTLTFAVGSEGSSIYGITADAFNINATVNTITIQRCRTSSVFILSAGNSISVLENWIGNILSVGAGSITGFKIKNNIVSGFIDIKTSDAATIENNTVISESYALNLNDNATVAVINNILKSGVGAPAAVQGSNATYSNNINITTNSSDNSIPITVMNNNQIVANAATVFALFPFTSDNDAQLLAGSPALNTGLYGSGDDIGAFNNGTGRATFVLGLIPPYPTIYALSGGNIISTPIMNVTISTRSNN